MKSNISGSNIKISDSSVVGANFFGKYNIEMRY